MARAGTDEPLNRKDYDRALRKLHGELVAVQQWVVQEGLKVAIVFEGRDGAGKGGTIKAITERVSPRVFRVVALPAPSDREKSQMYAQHRWRGVEHEYAGSSERRRRHDNPRARRPNEREFPTSSDLLGAADPG